MDIAGFAHLKKRSGRCQAKNYRHGSRDEEKFGAVKAMGNTTDLKPGRQSYRVPPISFRSLR
jgi:hypothetical protein